MANQISTAALPVPEGARPSPRARAILWRRKVGDWCAGHWMAIRPGPEARRGAVWGTLAAAAACVIIAGLYLRTGFGYVFDFSFAVVFAAVLIPLVAVSVALLLTIARKLPRLATGMIIGSCAIVMLVWSPPQLGMVMAILIGFAEGFLGATPATCVAGRVRPAAPGKKNLRALLFLLAGAGHI